MTTLAKNFETSVTNIPAQSGAYSKFISKIQFSYFSILAMSILISSCLGGVTAMKIFENDAPLWMFILNVGITMANLVGCLSQAPTKWVVNLFTASVIVNTLLLVLNLF